MITNLPVDEDVKDFTTPKRTIKFKIDDDVFEAAPEIAAGLMLEFASEADRLDEQSLASADAMHIMTTLMQALLLPQSFTVFKSRLSDQLHPIGVQTFADVVSWLLEQYGLRPTESDSESSPGSDNLANGTRSTESAFDPVSISGY